MNLSENFKQIEDIIDSRKLLGLYNIPKERSEIKFKSKETTRYSRIFRHNESVLTNEGDCSAIKRTDSEITVVRVKCQEIPSERNRNNKWDMHDIAIPGDGTHLAESPSLINLVTLVGDSMPFEQEEYLVPLSSWEPTSKFEEKFTELRCYSDSEVIKPSICAERVDNELKNDKSDVVCSRTKWAGKISKFLRKHCSRKTQNELSGLSLKSLK